MYDSAQKRIIDHTIGPALVLAGAGSGKTSCAVERAASRLRWGLPAENLFMLTFTNKACAEMRERLVQLLPPGHQIPSILTFHKFGYRLIQYAPNLMGRQGRPSLMDDKEPGKRLAEQLKGRGFKENDDLKRAGEYYEQARNKGLTPGAPEHQDALETLLSKDSYWGKSEQAEAIQGMIEYEAWKARCNLLDFGDLIALPVMALSRPDNAVFRHKIQSRIQDLTVDESQDNNLAQYELTRLVANQTVVMIGDDDQSIHRWRGAQPENLKRFIRDFSPTEYRLECNYRSTPNIVNPATTIIRHNKDRLEKNPFAHSAVDIPLGYDAHASFEEMADNLARQLAQSIAEGEKPGDCAVLYRTNRMARPIEAALIKHAVPYQIKQGMDLMHRLESQMVMAAMRQILNPSDLPALERLRQMVPGVGAKATAQLTAICPEHPLSAINQLKPGKARNGLITLVEALDVLKTAGPEAVGDWTQHNQLFFSWLNNECVKSARQAMRKRPQYSEDDFQRAVQGELAKRQETIDYLTASLRYRLEQEANSDSDPWTLAMDLIISPPDEDKDGGNRVTLSTIHSAKGLQWNRVHVAGISEGLLPLTREDQSINEESLIEERCLAYVAITRAQNNLHLHHCAYIDFPGTKSRFCTPSRFLYEGEIIERTGLVADLASSLAVDTKEPSSRPSRRRPGMRLPGLI